MKKITLIIFLITASLYSNAQADSTAIVNTIETFFVGMESNDTTKINTTVDSTFFLYTIMKNKNGQALLENETKASFYNQIVSLKDKKYDEQILSYTIHIDGAMAIAWAPYQFIFEGKFSHCGVNVFTMIKRETGWKIVGITDTRRRQGCN